MLLSFSGELDLKTGAFLDRVFPVWCPELSGSAELLISFEIENVCNFDFLMIIYLMFCII